MMTPQQAREFLKAQVKAERERPGKKKPLSKKPPKWKHPNAQELKYKREIRAFLRHVQKRTNEVVKPLLKRAEAEGRSFVEDSAVETVVAALASLKLQLNSTAEGFKKKTADLATLIEVYNKDQLNSILNSVLGVNIFVSEPWLVELKRRFAAENARLIKTIPDRFLDEVAGIVSRGVAEGIRAEDMQRQISRRFQVSSRRANTIARTEVAKLNGQLTRKRQAQLGINQYVWRTVRDERVRDNHARKEGQLFDWDSPPSDTGHPGNDFNCRCYAEPVIGFDELFFDD